MQEQMAFKTILLGPPFAGKTSLKNKYIKGDFDYQYNVTVGVEFSTKVLRVHDKVSVEIQLWDTIGQEMFRSIVRSYYHGVCAAILVFSIQNEQSFLQIGQWMGEVRQHCDPETVIVLVGSKADLDQNRQITKERAEEYLRSINGSCYFEVSAKTGQNVKQLFQKVARVMYKKFISSGPFRRLAKPKPLPKDDSGTQTKSIQVRYSVLSKSGSPTITKNKSGTCC